MKSLGCVAIRPVLPWYNISFDFLVRTVVFRIRCSAYFQCCNVLCDAGNNYCV